MLKVSLRAGGPDMITAGGDLGEILADLSVTVQCIHAQMRNQDPDAAELFKRALMAGIAMEDGPVWGVKPPEFVGFGFSTPMPGKDGGK